MDCADGEIWWTGHDDADRVTLTPLGQPGYDAPLLPPRYNDAAGALHAMTVALEAGEAPPELIMADDYIMSTALSEAAIASATRNGDWVEVADILSC